MTEDAEARAARLRAQSEEGATAVDRRSQARERAEKQVAAIRGTAQTEHGDVRVTVDHSGMLLRLELSPLTKQAEQDDLAQAITAVVHQATADARNQVRAVYVRLQNEGVIRALPPFLLPHPRSARCRWRCRCGATLRRSEPVTAPKRDRRKAGSRKNPGEHRPGSVRTRAGTSAPGRPIRTKPGHRGGFISCTIPLRVHPPLWTVGVHGVTQRYST